MKLKQMKTLFNQRQLNIFFLSTWVSKLFEPGSTVARTNKVPLFCLFLFDIPPNLHEIPFFSPVNQTL